MLSSQRDTRRRLEVAPTLWGTQKTGLYCLFDFRGLGREDTEGKRNGGHPSAFTVGRNGDGGDRSLYNLKGSVCYLPSLLKKK